jgi:hypothetical protein
MDKNKRIIVNVRKMNPRGQSWNEVYQYGSHKEAKEHLENLRQYNGYAGDDYKEGIDE